MPTRDAIAAFYLEQVPEQWNATLADQRTLARHDAEAARLLEEMEAVRASIVVRVEDRSAPLDFGYDIDRGEIARCDTPARAPFAVLTHARSDFDAIRAECGNSLLGFLGGLAGLGDALRITAQRVRSLRELAGGVVFERIGSGGFRLVAHFGVAPGRAFDPSVLPSPRATIRLDGETYARLRSGALDAQDAFLAGRVELEGDEGLAIGLALAAMSPE